MEDELFVMLDTTLSSFCWQCRGLQSVAKPASLQPRSDSFPSLSDKEHLTLGQPTAVKLRTRVLQLDHLEPCKKAVMLQGIYEIYFIGFVTLRADEDYSPCHPINAAEEDRV